MTLVELIALLRDTGYPVAFSHFKKTPNTPIPDPPFITYVTPTDNTFHADNKTYKREIGVDIELYTDIKDLTAEKKIEDLLDDNDIPWTATQIYIESEQLFQKIYEIGVI